MHRYRCLPRMWGKMGVMRGGGEWVEKSWIKKIGGKSERNSMAAFTCWWQSAERRKVITTISENWIVFSVNTISACGNNTLARIFILFFTFFSLSLVLRSPSFPFFLYRFSVFHREFQVQLPAIFDFDHFYFNEIAAWDESGRYREYYFEDKFGLKTLFLFRAFKRLL